MIRMPCSRRAAAFISNPRALIVAAAVFHIVVTLGVFSIGRLGIFPQQIDPAGIGQFAQDSRDFLTRTDSLADLLLHDGVVAWLKNPAQIHVKLYSLSFVVMRPLVGSNILAAEPVNLSSYLAILVLTFTLAKEVAGRRAAFVASVIVALWPSFLLHTTQLLRDPLLIAAMLALILVLTYLLTRVYNRAKGLALALAGSAAAIVILMSRSEIWPVVRTTVFAALVLFVIRMWRERKLLAGNLAGIVLLVAVMTFLLPIPTFIQREFGLSVGIPIQDTHLPLWARIAKRRNSFIESYKQSGSTIDSGITFANEGDVVRFIPRALEIGYLAPFPKMWFSPGHNVGWIGRVLSGVETSLTYVIELMACVFVWRNRRSLQVWLLVIAAALGILALGLVVVNVGTLYRMRYSFWVLLVILGSGGLVEIFSRRTPGGEVAEHSD